MPEIKFKFIYLLSFVCLSFTSVSLAQETLTITTYYPEPFGIYVDLHTEELFIKDPDGLDNREAISRSGDILEINDGPAGNRFIRTEIEGSTIISNGGLSVTIGAAVGPQPTGDLRVLGSILVGDKLIVNDTIFAPNVEVHDDVNVNNNVRFGGVNGITELVQFTSASGITQCPGGGYYAVTVLDDSMSAPASWFGFFAIPVEGYIVCMRHND